MRKNEVPATITYGPPGVGSDTQLSQWKLIAQTARDSVDFMFHSPSGDSLTLLGGSYP